MTSAKKKTYGTLLTLAALVMAVDHFLGDAGPIDVPASAIAQLVRPGANPAGAAEALVTQTAIPTLSFPRGLPRAELQGEMRDFFAPPFAKEPSMEEIGSLTHNGNPNDLSIDGFSVQYKLKAVLWSGDIRIAIINDRWHKEGDVIGGCRIGAVHERQVQVSCHDGDTTLLIGPATQRIPD